MKVELKMWKKSDQQIVSGGSLNDIKSFKISDQAKISSTVSLVFVVLKILNFRV